MIQFSLDDSIKTIKLASYMCLKLPHLILPGSYKLFISILHSQLTFSHGFSMAIAIEPTMQCYVISDQLYVVTWDRYVNRGQIDCLDVFKDKI